MYQLSTLLVFFAITLVNAVPLNINLGAYSPALVVGDGEISFGAATDVSKLMGSLQGATVPAAGAAAVAAAGATSTPATNAAVAVPVVADVPQTQVTQAQQADQAPSASSPTLQSGLGMGPDKEKKFILPRSPIAEAEANSGMDEAFKALKRDIAAIEKANPINSVLAARDLAGFQAALAFATAAMKVSPPVELGTGEGGSGVGIKVGSGASGTVAPAAAAKVVKRGLTAIKVISKRDISESGSDDADSSSPAASERSVDAVNLNLGDQSGSVSLTIAEI